MKTKITLIILILALTACGPAVIAAPTGTSVPTAVVTSTSTPFTLPTFPLFTAMSFSATALITETPSPMPTTTPIVPYTSDRFRKAFIKDGNLYVQDGLNPPIQLTHSGKDRNPIISDDGKKIVFYRGETDDNVYSINTDGNKELAIIVSKNLPRIGQGEIKALTFAPKSHFLLFNTYLCNPRPTGPSYNSPDCTVGVYRVDTDSGEVWNIVGGLSGNTLQERNFEVSPDGKFISVAASGRIEIYSGIEVVYSNAILYNRTRPDEFLPLQYWFPDSSGLIVIVATDEYNEPGTPPGTYAAIRYKLGEGVAQIPLDPQIIFNSGCNFSISPDRNWILFISHGNSKEWMLSLYLGNLKDGLSEPYRWDNGCPSSYYSTPKWSPDSKHFASSSSIDDSIGSVGGPPIHIGGNFVGWIDASHYIYMTGNSVNTTKSYIGEIGGESVPLPEGFIWPDTFVILPPTEP